MKKKSSFNIVVERELCNHQSKYKNTKLQCNNVLTIKSILFWSVYLPFFQYFFVYNFPFFLFQLFRFGVYLWTFGFTVNPYSHSVLFKLGSHQSHHVTDLITNNTSLFHQAVTLQNISISSITQAGCRNKNKTYEINGSLLTEKSKESNQCNGHLHKTVHPA